MADKIFGENPFQKKIYPYTLKVEFWLDTPYDNPENRLKFLNAFQQAVWQTFGNDKRFFYDGFDIQGEIIAGHEQMLARQNENVEWVLNDG